jgi:hypothetical protein
MTVELGGVVTGGLVAASTREEGAFLRAETMLWRFN